jgi:hypothetical protein
MLMIPPLLRVCFMEGLSNNSHFSNIIRAVLQRAGAACARPLKGGVWPSLLANASDRKDSFSTARGARIDWAHQPTRVKKMVGQILHSHGKQLLPPFFTVPDVCIGCVERGY